MSYPASGSCIELPAYTASLSCVQRAVTRRVPTVAWPRHRRAAAVAAGSSASAGLSGYRCQYCYNIHFSTPAKLARHIVVEHQAFVPDSQPQCPYCGASSRNRSALADHFRSGCDKVGQCTIPSLWRRKLSSEALAADPKYPLLAESHTALGHVEVRPLHPDQQFEAALLVSEAFLVDPDPGPPEFGWTRRELQRDVERYNHDPTPITQGHVNYAWDPRWDVRWDARLPWGDQRSESYRIYQLQAWGRWIWLAADLVPNDPSKPGRLVGAIAVMLHERKTALARLKSLAPDNPQGLLDPPLWVLPKVPEGWPADRVAFFWWTGIDTSLRRSKEFYQASMQQACLRGQGLGTLLLKAGEQVARKAGFLDAYVQACTKQRGPSHPLRGCMMQPYTAATQLYSRAGYEEWQPGVQRYTQRHVVLMHKALA